MARHRQYDDPISIPFGFGTKGEIVRLASEHSVAQADIVRWCVDESLASVTKKIESGELQ